MSATPDLDEVVAARLHAGGQRFTSGRRRIVAVLRDAVAPITIPQVLGADRALSQSSAYRNLAILEQVGVVTRIVTTDDFARYELAEDLTEHHHHLICSTCGNVTDFALRPALEADLERALRNVARRSSFTALGHRLDIVGRCQDCR